MHPCFEDKANFPNDTQKVEEYAAPFFCLCCYCEHKERVKIGREGIINFVNYKTKSTTAVYVQRVGQGTVKDRVKGNEGGIKLTPFLQKSFETKRKARVCLQVHARMED